MDDPSLTSTTRPNTLPSIQIHVPSANADRRSVSRPSPFDLPSQGMPIPGAGLDVPPPLPPPPFIPAGEDLGYKWANKHATLGRYEFPKPSLGPHDFYGSPPPKISLRDARPRHPDEGYSSLSSVALTPPMSVSRLSFP